MKKTARLLTVILLAAFMAAMLCGCTSKEEKYSKALNYYSQAQFSDALNIFKTLGTYEDAADLKQRCKLASDFSNLTSAKDMILSWINDNPGANEKELTYAKDFFQYALKYSENNGCVDIFAGIYPYIKDACSDTINGVSMYYLPASLEAYLSQLVSLNSLYCNNPRIAKRIENNNLISFNHTLPEMDDFCSWVEEKSDYSNLISLLSNYVEPAKYTISELLWSDEELYDYFDSTALNPSNPQDMTVLLAYSNGMDKKTSLASQQTKLFSSAIPDLIITENPDEAKLYIICSYETETYTYYSSERKSADVQVGIMDYLVIEGNTNTVVGRFTYKDVPDEIYASGGEVNLKDSDISVQMNDEDFLSFCEIMKYELTK